MKIRFVLSNHLYWYQIRGISGNYDIGLGDFLPDSYYYLYGSASFCELPLEIGGIIRRKRKEKRKLEGLEEII